MFPCPCSLPNKPKRKTSSHEMVHRRSVVAARGPVSRIGPAGLCHVRAARRAPVHALLARAWITNLSATRMCKETTAEIGDAVPVELTVRNNGWLPIPWLLLEDLLPRDALNERPPRLRTRGKRLQVCMLSPHAEKTFKYKIQCQQRGYYQIGPLVLETGDLFGLHRRYRVESHRTICWFIRGSCRSRVTTSPRGGRSAMCA